MLPVYLYNTYKNYKDAPKSQKGETSIPYFSLTGVKKSLHEGPGTSFEKQKKLNEAIKSGNEKEIQKWSGVSNTDRRSALHDGYYYKAETKEDIDKADKHFIEKNLKEWYNPNALAAAIGMKAKNMFSKYGVPEDGISDYNKMSQEDRDIIDQNIKYLEEKGYGQIHQVIFDKKYYTLSKSKDWLKKHQFTGLTPKETEKQYIFKQNEDIPEAEHIKKELKKGLNLSIVSNVGKGFFDDFNKIWDKINYYTFDQVNKIPIVGEVSKVVQSGFNLPNHIINTVANKGHRMEYLKKTTGDALDLAKLALIP